MIIFENKVAPTTFLVLKCSQRCRNQSSNKSRRIQKVSDLVQNGIKNDHFDGTSMTIFEHNVASTTLLFLIRSQ